MSAATASITDVSRTDFTSNRNNSGHSQAQCTPMPLPALGTQRIIQGNGTNVGTIISLQCPANHKLIGKDLICVRDINSTYWMGETYCKPLSPYEDYGFRVAVLASIVSSAIIFFMSMAFITCCLLDCIREDERKKQEREWQWEEQAQQQGNDRSRYSHKGRNNNNNNAQEKVLSLWDTHGPAPYDNMHAYRCHQHYAYGPACTYDRPPPHAPLPCVDYDQPLLPQNPESAHISGPPQYHAPSPSSFQTPSQGLVQISGPGLVWQYGGQQSGLSGVDPSTADESNTRNININSAKELSIRIISV